MDLKRYASLWATTLFLMPVWVAAQVPTASFATWKDNKKAAYTIIHDDYGDVTTPGIAKYADTIAFNRGIRINFGAITSVTDALGWSDAQRLITHNHEIINHSHSHRCALGGASWCTDTYTDLDLELGTSTQLIEQNAGQRPRFFIHPFDVFNEDIHAYLKNIGYLGARAGTQATFNAPNFSDYFHLNFYVYAPGNTLAQLNQGLLAAIAAGGYGVQELHGVQDDSWGMVTLANYRSHLNLVKDKINTGEVWASTLGEVVTYRIQRGAYTPSATYNATLKKVTVNFAPITGQTVNTAVLKSPVTINVGLASLPYTGVLTVTQNGQVIPAADIKVTPAGLAVNAYPYKGALVISGNFGGSCAPNCPPEPCVVDGKTISDVFLSLNVQRFNMLDLTTDLRYPNRPTRSEVMTNVSGFQRGDLGTNYGERVRGYLIPKTTGAYTFTITGDDDTELWLSVSDNPAGKRKIAGFTGYTASNQFTKYPGQKSAPIVLTAGKSYYLEVLHVGFQGVDVFKIHWQTPTNPAITVIKNDVLSSKPCTPITIAAEASAIRDIFAFGGYRQGNKAKLNWVNSAAVQTADYFVVEKLLPTGDFSTLDHVNADMNAGETRSFSFTDEKPAAGENYYRIKLVSQNGAARYSEIVPLAFDESNWRVYPNPAQDFVELDLKSRANQSGRVEVYDAFGRVVLTQTIDRISETPYRLNLEGVSNSGQHWVRVHVEGARDLVSPILIAKE
jgi:PA14 domain/Polysaccharide deacetylase/Secretion system C-terminal sorting domain